jgi:twinkle protein
MKQTESQLLRHIRCPKCNSSDGNALYDDGHTYCFVCTAYVSGDGVEKKGVLVQQKDLVETEIRDIVGRRLTKETCKHFNYGFATVDGQEVHVANYTNSEGVVVGQKLRYRNKDFVWRGSPKEARLFGEHCWRDKGKMVVVTEGEIDAMSLSQVQGNKWPVVSVRNGAAGACKDIKQSLDFLEGFESVIFMFDNDAVGQKAATECASLLTPGKAKIAKLPLKDASDMLKAGRTEELINAIWSAKVSRPDGVINGNELWEPIMAEDKEDSIPYPWEGLNSVLRGIRKSEVVVLCAGSGIGKSAVVREIAYDAHRRGETIGYIALEEAVKRTGLMFMGLDLNKRVYLDRSLATVEELKGAYDRTVGSGRFYLYDHFGSLDIDNLLARIRYLARGCGCTTIVLDHISIVVSGTEDGDERRLLDNLMTGLRTLVQELNIRVLAISHLKRPQGKGHEEGARTELSQLRGSAAIAQLSDAAIGLERDQQGEHKDYTCLRVLKNRYTGETGEACWLKYDKDTGRLLEVPAPVDEDEAASSPQETLC